ncbi:hypothetical protein HNV08_06745 [Winogradskyella eckloniae]|uniref:hypothetical protein n=1 Tax=Winogradskyella eckloniae TaxID=1089306 RepID=UPI0015664FCE|nr:hypothetical protein [Winogradskyella eckloniae]NRD19741.1 hypothetical protein [Winogradskyella eckloniae]
MNHLRFFLVVTLIFSTFSFAHDANKSFFKIQQKGQNVEVQAEFPWSIRNAVIKAFPDLENSNLQSDFEAAFFQYIDHHFQIAHGNSALKLVAVEEVAHSGHSHQNNFVLLYEGNAFDTIKNTILFNIYKDQENYHEILIEPNSIKFITSIDADTFKLQDTSAENYNDLFLIGLVLLSVVVVFLGIAYKRRNK